MAQLGTHLDDEGKSFGNSGQKPQKENCLVLSGSPAVMPLGQLLYPSRHARLQVASVIGPLDVSQRLVSYPDKSRGGMHR